MKPKSAIKRRNRREGQIAKEAQTNLNAAVELAQYGHHLTPMEWEVWTYYLQVESGKKFGLKKPLPLLQASRLWRLFLDAVNRHDDGPLREMAQAVKSFQPISAPLDELRKDILILKGYLDSRGQKMTFKEFGIAINRRVGIPAIDKAIQEGKITDCDRCLKIPDSTLRCLAKQLHFPLAKDKTGRPKNSAK